MNKKALCWLEVNFDNIEHNFMKLKELNNGKKVCAVIKANAYGLGSCEVARFLESKGVDFFAVARVEEALDELEAYLDKASLVNLTPVFIIHGHGTGALKQCVRDFLSTSPYVCKYRAGENAEGGDGVSVVDIN